MFGSQSLKKRFDFSKTESQTFTVHSIRLAFLLLVFLFTISFQILEKRVDALQVFMPMYILIGLSFFLQALFFVFFKRLHNKAWANGFLFAFEAFFVTALIYFIGVQQSLIIFLYLVNIILCGILYQRQGALILALWSSVLFSFIISLDTGLSGNTAYLAVGVNNLAFFTVGYLAGFLSEQLNIMGEELKERVRDVATLKNLNELILSSINSGLMTVDGQRIILQSNPAAHFILGKSQHELMSQSLEEIVPGLNIQNDSDGKEFDLNYKKEGEKRILTFSVSPLKDERGKVQGRIVSFQDHTHMRALEKRLRQSEKMAAIGQLAAGIAHEIRNPLAGISGSIQLMQSGDAEPEQTGKLMGIVSKEIDRLNNLITEFLDFAKPEAPMEDRIDLGKLLEETALFIKNDSHFSSAEIQFNFEDGVQILGNRDKLRQAFLNIMVNGIQAMEGTESPSMQLGVRKSGKFVFVSIKDQGVGMSEELRDRIFEPFHTTKHKGTGLGLAITHSIVEAHGAEIHVDSEPGEGTEFRLQFKALSST